MSTEDHASFDELLRSIPGITIALGKSFDEILLLDGRIQYARSQLSDNILTAGRIAIATMDLAGNHNFDSYEEVEKLYKKLRSWLKKHSTNELVCKRFTKHMLS